MAWVTFLFLSSNEPAQPTQYRYSCSYADPGSTMGENWEITTGDGSVSLYLPTGFGAELDAHTGDGSIRSDLAGLPPPTREQSRRTLRGKIGDGGKLLRVRTGDGAIRLGTS